MLPPEVLKSEPDALNLLYVAATRAKYGLLLNPDLARVMQHSHYMHAHLRARVGVVFAWDLLSTWASSCMQGHKSQKSAAGVGEEGPLATTMMECLVARHSRFVPLQVSTPSMLMKVAMITDDDEEFEPKLVGRSTLGFAGTCVI